MSFFKGEIYSVREEISEILSDIFRGNSESDILYKILDDLLYAMNDSTNIVILNNKANFLYVNDSFCCLTKYTKSEIIGNNYRLVGNPNLQKAMWDEVWTTISKGNSWYGELQNVAKDGSIYWGATTIVPIADREGIVQCYICFQIDITEKKQVETEFRTNFIRTFQNLQNGIFKVRKDANGKIQYTMAEGRLMERIDATNKTIHLKSPMDVFEPEIAKIKEKYYLKAFEGNRVQYEVETNGVLIYVDLEPIKKNGEVVEVVGTVHDFSEFRDVQKQLKENEEKYQSLVNYSHEYIVTFNEDGVILHMNAKTCHLFGIDESRFSRMHVNEIIPRKDYSKIRFHFDRALRGELQLFEFEVNNGTNRTFLSITLVPIVTDNVISTINAIGIDITNEKLIQERNAYLAHHDNLTGLPNRYWMEQRINNELEKNPKGHYQFALLSLDLDRFKFINDTLGHHVGDELLQQIAGRLQQLVEQNQIDAARMGGDEFMILCPNIRTKAEITTIAQNILDTLEHPFYIQGSELLITASIGILLHPEKNHDTTELMKQVDLALYKSKDLGRNMYHIYDNSMKRGNYERFLMERDLRKALLNEELVAYFQPKVDAFSEKIIGAEALIRWNHPDKGLVSPGQFIPIAEETGLVIPIGKWMKRKVCEQLVEWRRKGIPLVPISINISSDRLLQQDFATNIKSLLNEFELEAEWLEFEITENSIMRNEAIVQKTLNDLKEMGVKIWIDDFGTGYSSFNYLKTYKIDGVKIDRSFIKDIDKKPENASITLAMIKVAQQLNLEVIAEGVETKEELNYLLTENCHHIQGFYYGKPCTIEQFEHQFLKK